MISSFIKSLRCYKVYLATTKTKLIDYRIHHDDEFCFLIYKKGM